MAEDDRDEPSDRQRAERCEARIRALYGTGLPRSVGVLHVVAVWEAPGPSDCVMRIGPDTPKSATDLFVLDVARARADVIVATGKILRDEPRVRHAYRSDAAADLEAWRSLVLCRDEPPRSAILTSGRDLDLDHPLLRDANRPLVYTSPLAARRLAEAAAARGIEVIGRERLSIRDLVSDLELRGARTISIEAGPTTAVPLYEPRPLVRELMLSVYLEPDLAPVLRGPSMPHRAHLASLLPHRAGTAEVTEPSGHWAFYRCW